MIGLCGSHRTGKTTLADKVAERMEIPFVKIDSTSVMQRLNLDPRQDYNFDTRLFAQQAILDNAEKAYKRVSGMFVTDRTPLDFLAYTYADIGRETLNAQAELSLQRYTRKCIDVLHRHFRMIVLIPPGIPMVEEVGKAPCSQGYIDHLNLLLMGMINMPTMKMHRFRLGFEVIDLERRIDAVLSAWNHSCNEEIREGVAIALVDKH